MSDRKPHTPDLFGRAQSKSELPGEWPDPDCAESLIKRKAMICVNLRNLWFRLYDSQLLRTVSA